MKIINVQAFAIQMPPMSSNEGSINTDSYGDYFIAKDAWTSIYSHSHETCLVRLETDLPAWWAGVKGDP
ncbi:MAG: hypothetical protein R3A44_42025 [Caldilineaceae bacterium]